MPRTNNFPGRTPNKSSRRLYWGRFQPVLETALAEEITAHQKLRGPLAPVTVIVPTRLLGLHVQRSLAERAPNGLANVRFERLEDLLPAKRLLSPLALQLLCRELARNPALFPDDGYFAPIRNTPGFASALAATFNDLQESGLTPAEFKKAVSTPKQRELTAAYEAFVGWLVRNDFATSAQLFSEPLTANAQTHLMLYGYYDLNQVQRGFVQRLQPAVVFFPDYEHKDYARPTLDWFQSLGYDPVPPPSEIIEISPQVVSCPGETAEVREAVRLIFDYLKTHPDKTLADCALLCRAREPYDVIVRDTVPPLGVRVYTRGGRPLSEHPDATLLHLLLGTIRSNFSRASVMELACHIGPYSRWDALSVRLGVVGGQEQWLARIQAAAVKSGDENDSTARTAQQLLPFLEQLFQAAGNTPVQAAWKEYAGCLLAAFAKTGGHHPPVVATVKALEELDAVQSPVAFDTFAEFCEQAMAGEREQSEKFGGGGLFFSDVMGARGLSFSFVVVLGLVEKGFPRLIQEDPLLLDDERARVSDSLPLKRRGHEEERLLFDLACAVARESLVLTYPRIDPGTARPRMASFLLLEATGASSFKALEQLPAHRSVPLSIFVNAEHPVDERELDLSALRSLRQPDSYLQAVSPLIAAGVAAERLRWRSNALTRFDGLLGDEAALRVLRERFGLEKLSTSATALEQFFHCPFYYFQKHVLRIDPWEEPEAALVIDALDLGKLYHAILEDYFRSGPTAQLDAIIDGHFRRFEQEGVTGYPSVWAVKQEIVRHELNGFVARERLRLGDEWLPREFEKEFNGLIVAPPVRLRGKIDRIDLSADGRHARVLDYKTGRVPAGLQNDSLARGAALQLPLYLLAAEQLLRGVTVDAASYLYFTLRGGYRTVTYSQSALADQRAELHRLLQTAADMIREGVFAQYATADGCRRCDFRPICGNGILKLAGRKAEAAETSAFRDIKEGGS